jgi:RNA polymerase sigma-70 factor (ECF subfamily)
LRQALTRLQDEARRNGKDKLFEQLRPFLLENPDGSEYDIVASALGMRRNTVAVAVHRLRARLQEVVRAVVADTVDDPREAELELRRLRHSLPAPAPV